MPLVCRNNRGFVGHAGSKPPVCKQSCLQVPLELHFLCCGQDATPVANLLLDAVFLRLKSQILGVISVTCLHGMRSYRYTYSRTATLSLIVRSFIISHQQHHSSFSIIHHRSSSFIFKSSSPPCFDLPPLLFFRATHCCLVI